MTWRRLRKCGSGSRTLFSLTTVNYGYWSGRMTAAYPENQAAEAQKQLGTLLAAIRLQQPKPPKR